MRRRGDSVVGSDGTKVLGMEIVQLPNKEVNIFWRDRVILLKVIKSNEGEGSRKIPPENVNGRAGVLERGYNVNDRVLAGEI